MYGAVGANTNSSYGKMYGPHKQISLKIILTFDCGKGETIYMFKLYPEEHNGTILLMYEACAK